MSTESRKRPTERAMIPDARGRRSDVSRCSPAGALRLGTRRKSRRTAAWRQSRRRRACQRGQLAHGPQGQVLAPLGARGRKRGLTRGLRGAHAPRSRARAHLGGLHARSLYAHPACPAAPRTNRAHWRATSAGSRTGCPRSGALAPGLARSRAREGPVRACAGGSETGRATKRGRPAILFSGETAL